MQLYYKMRIALGRLKWSRLLLPSLGPTVPTKVYLHLEMCCGCITTWDGARERGGTSSYLSNQNLCVYSGGWDGMGDERAKGLKILHAAGR